MCPIFNQTSCCACRLCDQPNLSRTSCPTLKKGLCYASQPCTQAWLLLFQTLREPRGHYPCSLGSRTVCVIGPLIDEEAQAQTCIVWTYRSEQERLKHRSRQAEDQVTSLRRQLDDRSREVEQLTTLSLKGDATLQEYMAHMTVSANPEGMAVLL